MKQKKNDRVVLAIRVTGGYRLACVNPKMAKTIQTTGSIPPPGAYTFIPSQLWTRFGLPKVKAKIVPVSQWSRHISRMLLARPTGRPAKQQSRTTTKTTRRAPKSTSYVSW